jgi:hypothetical protein
MEKWDRQFDLHENRREDKADRVDDEQRAAWATGHKGHKLHKEGRVRISIVQERETGLYRACAEGTQLNAFYLQVAALICENARLCLHNILYFLL